MPTHQDTSSKGLLCESRAQTLFTYCAWWITTLAVFLLLVVPIYDRVASDDVARLTIQVIGGCLGSVGGIAGLVIFFGMLAYLFACDRSSRKALWVLIFLLTACFGSSLYFFMVYRKQMRTAHTA
jgi:uncharacterized membrane protein YfcA